MISIAYAFAPVAAVSLFAAAVPVLSGMRQRQGRLPAVSRTGEDALEITSVAAEHEDALLVGATNRTQEVRTLELSVSLYDHSGTECARFELPARRLLPGRAVQERLDLHTLGDGRHQVVVVASFGGEWFGARCTWARTPQPTRLTVAA